MDCQPGISVDIFCKPICMGIAIELDTEFCLGTVEIQYIRTRRILPTKLVSELLVTQQSPELAF